MERALIYAPQIDCNAYAPFEGGIFLLSNETLIRYSIAGDTKEKYNLDSELAELANKNRIIRICADTKGDYVLIQLENDQFIFSRHTRKLYLIPHPCTPSFTSLDQGIIINLFETAITTHSLLGLLKNASATNTFIFRVSYLMQDNIKLVTTAGNTLIQGDLLLELDAPNDLLLPSDTAKGPTKKLFQRDANTSSSASVSIRRCVLLKPEPITFLHEKQENVYFAEWGMVILYETGAEIYKRQGKDYRLGYIYKSKLIKVNSRPTSLPEKQLFFISNSVSISNTSTISNTSGNTAQVIELKEDAPFLTWEIPLEDKTRADKDSLDSLIIFHCGSYLLDLSRGRALLLPQETHISTQLGSLGHPPSIIPQAPAKTNSFSGKEEEKTVSEALLKKAASIQEYLMKYSTLNYSFLVGRQEQEQELLLERVLVSLRKNICSKVLALLMTLKEKLLYLERAQTETLEVKNQSGNALIGRADKASALIKRLERTLSQVQQLKEALARKEKESPEVSALRDRIKEIAAAVKVSKILPRSRKAEQEAQLLLLKQQRAFLRRKIAGLLEMEVAH